MDLNEFEQYRENNRLEAKRAQGRDGSGELSRSMWETLSAFANEAGGVILLGVIEVGPEKKLEAVGLRKARPESRVARARATRRCFACSR